MRSRTHQSRTHLRSTSLASPLANARGFAQRAGLRTTESAPQRQSGRDPRTGLPRRVKHAAEQRSGLSMDDVRVTYNGTLPGTVGARALTKGNRISVAPGEESSVAHELWHVVQQKQGRVGTDGTKVGHPINRDAALESEADAFRDEGFRTATPDASPDPLRSVASPGLAPMQLNGHSSDEEDEESSSGSDEEEEESSSSGSEESDGGRAKKRLRAGSASNSRSAKAPGRTTVKKGALPPRELTRKKPPPTKTKSKWKKTVSSEEEEEESSSSSGEEEESSSRSSSSGEEESSSSSGEEEEESSSSAGEEEEESSSSSSEVVVRKKRATPSKSVKKAPVKKPAPKKQRKASNSDDEEEPVAGPLEGLLGYQGAKQQGMIPIGQGKAYEGPVSQKGKRAEQVTRHLTNLALNSATLAQSKKDVRTKEKGKKDKVKKAVRPVEVQLSSVGRRVLINANNRESTETIESGIGKGSLFDYVTGAGGQTPALDKDLERPKRYRSKLQKAKAKTRGWQSSKAVGEDALDIKKAESILKASQGAGVGRFDLDDEAQIHKEVEKWRKDTAPSAYVVLHGGEQLKGEHAERVQSYLRDKYLKEFETETSTPPTGPKTTCLGCSSHHKAKYPKLLHPSPYTGAYFGSGSPVSTPKEVEAAKDFIKTRPATGSVSQTGYIRNSDYADSDTDDEGNIAYPLPKSFSVPYGGKNPTTRIWRQNSRDVVSVAASKKRHQVSGARQQKATANAGKKQRTGKLDVTSPKQKAAEQLKKKKAAAKKKQVVKK